jgi:heat-inducible transcriptional repressor
VKQRTKKGRVRDDDEVDLDAREAAILKSVISQHILTGEPIGSRAIARRPRLDLSPATIRGVMAELEERGLLTQPHVSAGRLPTAKAYRIYVDRMIGKPKMAPDQTVAIDEAMGGHHGEITELLEEASRQLSRFSNQVGVVLAPELKRTVVEHLEFVRLDLHRVVAILVGRSGVVHNRILEVDEPLGQHELDGIGRYLSAEFRGLTLTQMRRALQRRMSEELATYDRLVARSLDLGRRTVAAEAGEAGVFVDGTSNLLDQPEFSADPERIKELMRALDRKKTLIDLLGRVLEDEGLQVIIGDENPESGLARCSLVASTYGAGGRVMGTLGIVGPTRMEYAQAIALVDYLAQVLGQYFSRPDN